MIVALLALLGVNLIVIVFVIAGVVSRKRWVKRQPSAFRGAIRVATGELDGLDSKWKRGYGHWVRDCLVWTKAPLLFRNEILPADGLEDERSESSDKVKHLGDGPIVIKLKIGSAAVEVAAAADDRGALVGPYPSTE
jgi:hypothetical protein